MFVPHLHAGQVSTRADSSRVQPKHGVGDWRDGASHNGRAWASRLRQDAQGVVPRRGHDSATGQGPCRLPSVVRRVECPASAFKRNKSYAEVEIGIRARLREVCPLKGTDDPCSFLHAICSWVWMLAFLHHGSVLGFWSANCRRRRWVSDRKYGPHGCSAICTVACDSDRWPNSTVAHAHKVCAKHQHDEAS